ncbi:histone-fold-containing protein [Dissophora ornata]|nr:histone-fold-containing protein [Dissophora ornata]
MAGSSGKKSTTGSSGRVQKKVPAKSAAASKNTSGSGSGSSVYTGTAKGVTVLPVARVKRIIKEDKDVQMVSNDAVFLISLATELFLESFTSKAYNLAKMEKRKTVSYKDLATAVTQYDSLEFLQDVVPKTTPLSAALEKRRVAKEKEENGTMEDDEEGDQENNAAQEESEGEGERSGSEEANNSRGHMSDEEDLSAPEDMDED